PGQRGRGRGRRHAGDPAPGRARGSRAGDRPRREDRARTEDARTGRGGARRPARHARDRRVRRRDAGVDPAGEDETVAVGHVGRPHGLEGSFVVERPSENEQLFEPGATLYADGRPVTVAARKRSGGRLVIRLEEAAERGAQLGVPLSVLPEPDEDSYYVFQ